MPFIDSKAPGKPRNVNAATYAMTGTILSWEAPKAKKEMDKARHYVVYRFKQGEKINLNSAENIIAVTQDTRLTLPSVRRGTTIVVTALDRLHNESKPVKVKL